MLLNLKQVGTGGVYDENTLDFARGLDLSAVRLWGERPFLKPVQISGRVTCRSGVYTIRYAADFEISGRCSRCLNPVVKALKREFEHTILVDSEEADAETTGFLSAPGAELDLDELVISDLLFEFSGVLLCGEDCRGLCPKCGKNLNESACGCDLREPDARFDVIRKLLQE